MVEIQTTSPTDAFKTSTPEYDYWSAAHSLAAEQLEFAVRSMILLTVFTGEHGSGKSTVLRKVLADTQPDLLVGLLAHDTVLYANPAGAILKALGAEVDPAQSPAVLETVLRQSLSNARLEQRLATIIVDDAHRLSTGVLSKLFRLAGLHSGEAAALFKVVLVGQPDLSDRLSKDIYDLIGPAIELELMSEADTAGYIMHRLKTAHSDDISFTKEALQVAYEQTGGRPSLINLLCKSALITAKTLGLDHIDAKLVGNRRTPYAEKRSLQPDRTAHLKATSSPAPHPPKAPVVKNTGPDHSEKAKRSSKPSKQLHSENAPADTEPADGAVTPKVSKIEPSLRGSRKPETGRIAAKTPDNVFTPKQKVSGPQPAQPPQAPAKAGMGRLTKVMLGVVVIVGLAVATYALL